MKRFALLLFVCVGFARPGFGQVDRLLRSEVPELGCYLYTFGLIENWEKSYSEDSAVMYFGSVMNRGFTFQCIVVQFTEELNVPMADREALLIAYMDYLKGYLEVTGAVGYGKGHTNSSSTDATGVLDYWQCADGDQMVVKGWVDPKLLAVVYIKGKGEYPNDQEQELFLDGFRFRKVP